jgi:hypothetical protein
MTSAVPETIPTSSQVVDCNNFDPHPDVDSVRVNDREVGVRHVCQRVATPVRPNPLGDVEAKNPLETVLLGAPERIEAIERSLWQQTRGRQALKEALAVIEAKKVALIAAELNDAGKPKFPNEAAREAQLRVSISIDQDYQHLHRQLLDRDEAIARTERELRRSELEFKAAHALIITRARIRLEAIL